MYGNKGKVYAKLRVAKGIQMPDILLLKQCIMTTFSTIHQNTIGSIQ